MVRLFIPITLIALGIISDVYIYNSFIHTTSTWRWLWWLPMLVIFLFVAYFVCFGQGMVEEYVATEIFLLLLGLFVIPKMLFALFAWIPKLGVYVGGLMAFGVVFIVLWGITFGFSQLRVRRITYESMDVPKSFDGYKIVQFSDAHTGVFRGPYRHLVQSSVDCINALQPDLICFVGDIENFVPSELTEYGTEYAQLKAKDGVMTIMGNHDYSEYTNASPHEKAQMVAQTRAIQKGYGWRMLENENVTITRKAQDTTDSIVVVGEENWGKPPFPQYGDIAKATAGLRLKGKRVVDEQGKPVVSIMLSHDPTAWKAHIMPVFHPDITLSGHTHGTQFSLFGWSPASMVYNEWRGEYYEEDSPGEAVGGNIQRRLLNVTTGFGGNFSFRFNMPREVVLITLRHKE